MKNVELRDKNERLEEALTELRNAQAQLIQDGKMAALGHITAGLAHEINNPVGAIKSAADVSRRVLDRLRRAQTDGGGPIEMNEEARRLVGLLDMNVGNTELASESLERIVRSFRAFTRVDEAPFQKADIHEGLDATLTLLRPDIPAGVEVVRDYGALPEIHMYPSEMNQVFMNLIVNALQAMEGSGAITVRTWAQDGHVNVEIHDSGKGIPQERLERLFEPGFTRKHTTVRMRTGLYTSRNIIRNHFGELNVESKLGEGTRFHIRVPEGLDRLLAEKAVKPA